MRTTKALSPDSVKYINRIRKSQKTTPAATSQLWRELVDIMSFAINNSSSDLSITAIKSENEDLFGVTIQSCYADRRDISLTIKIDVLGASTIVAQAPRTSLNSPLLTKFKQSAGYKRYFALDNSNGTTITAKIPSRQVTSRHLTDYLIHLLDQLQPFFMTMDNIRCITQAA